MENSGSTSSFHDDTNTDSNLDHACEEAHVTDSETNSSSDEETCSRNFDLPENMANKYLFKIREENRLTTACTDKIVETTSHLLGTVISFLKKKTCQSLENAGVNIGDIPQFQEAFLETDNFLQDLTSKRIFEEIPLNEDYQVRYLTMPI